ncbi:potassium:proton antiporter [Aureococcus anophagefferens]|nr:potassium:proton antiporter [Aureococcus anophagefferens]
MPRVEDPHAEQAMEELEDAVEEWGGDASMLDGWRTEVHDRPTGSSAGTTDRYYFDEFGKRFRSKAEIARALGLAGAPARHAGARAPAPPRDRTYDARDGAAAYALSAAVAAECAAAQDEDDAVLERLLLHAAAAERRASAMADACGAPFRGDARAPPSARFATVRLKLAEPDEPADDGDNDPPRSAARQDARDADVAASFRVARGAAARARRRRLAVAGATEPPEDDGLPEGLGDALAAMLADDGRSKLNAQLAESTHVALCRVALGDRLFACRRERPEDESDDDDDAAAPNGKQTSSSVGLVEGYLPPEEADFLDDAGAPAALWSVRYVSGELAGDREDLEAAEVEESGPRWRCRTGAGSAAAAPTARTSRPRPAPRAAAPAKAGKAKPKASAGGGRAPSKHPLPMAAIAMLVGDAVPLAVRQHNPKGGASRARYEGYKSATNAKVFIALGGSKGDLQNDLIKGHIQLLGPDGEPIEWHTHEHVVAVAVTGPAAGRKAAAAAPVAACLAIAVLGDGHDDDGSVASDSSHDDSSHDDGHGDDGHDSSSHAHGGEHANHAAPLILLVVALFFGVLAKTLLAKSKIPYTVLPLLAGVAVGWGVDYEGADDKKPLHRSVRAWDRVNPHLLMYLFLPVLIFESAFSVDVHTLFRELFQVLTLAVPGVALSTALTACVARRLFAGQEFTWAASLMLGAILSATDPVAVVALLKELGVSKRVGTLIEGESLFNDGTAIVVFNVFFHELRDRGNGGGIDGGEVAVYFLRLAGGGVLLGVLVGGATVLGLSYIYDDGLSEITLTIVAAMGTFLIAEMITVDGQALTSGVLAVVALGLIVGSKGASRVSATVGHDLHATWEALGFVANTLIFFVAGLIVEVRLSHSEHVARDLGQLAVLYAALHVIRFAVLLVAWPLLRRMGYGMDWKFGVALCTCSRRPLGEVRVREAEFVAVGRELSLASDDHARRLRDDDRFLVDCDWATCLRYLPVHDAETYRTRLAATEAGAAPLMAKRWHGYAKAFGGPNAAPTPTSAKPPRRRASVARVLGAAAAADGDRSSSRSAPRAPRRAATRSSGAAPRACSTASRRAAAWASAAARRGSPRAPILDRLFRANLAYAFDVASCYAWATSAVAEALAGGGCATADAAGAELAEEAEKASRWLDEYLGAFPEVARSVTTEAAARVVLARETEDVLERVHAGELGSREERVLRAALAASAARLDFGRTAIPPPTALAKLKNLPGLAIFDRLHGLGPLAALARRPAYATGATLCVGESWFLVLRGEARCLRAAPPRPRRARGAAPSSPR